MKRNRKLVRILTACVFSLCACARTVNRPVLRYQLGAEPVSLDPALAEDGVSLQVLSNTMLGLVGYDGAGKLQNRLAETVRISSDRKRYEFKIRDDAKWSDGKAVTAADFVTGFRRVLAPSTLSKLSALFLPIEGAPEYHSGKKPAEALRVFEESGKLVIQLSKPISYFLQMLTLTSAMPARADLLEASHGRWLDRFPTTGPYKIREHTLEEKIVLEENPLSTVHPSIPTVEMWIVPDENTGANLFAEGRLDILSRVPFTDIAKYRADHQLVTSPFYATYYLGFNVAKAPFDRVLNRRAVAASIDKAQVVQALAAGDRVAQSFVPYGIEGAFENPIPDLKPAAPQMEQARSELSALPSVSLCFDSSARNSMILEKVQSDLKSALGLKLSLDNRDWKSFIRSIQTDATPIFRFGFLAPFNDPIVHLQIFTSDNPNNYSHWRSPAYDALVSGIESMPPSPAREKAIEKAQWIIERDAAVVIPIYHYVQNQAVAQRVSGFRANPFGEVLFSELGLN